MKRDEMLTADALMRRDAAPVWKQIEEALADDVATGRFVSGEQLPTEKALAERFGVNRHTIRRAVAALVERGLVDVRQGSGMFVPHLPLDYAIGPVTRFSANVMGAMRAPSREVLGIDTCPADGETAKALQVRGGSAVVRLRSISLADGQPIVLATTCFPARLKGIEQALREDASITGALARAGVADYVRQSTRIYTTMPDPEEAELLRQSMRRPVLITESIDADPEGRPISFGISIFAGERVQLTV